MKNNIFNASNSEINNQVFSHSYDEIINTFYDFGFYTEEKDGIFYENIVNEISITVHEYRKKRPVKIAIHGSESIYDYILNELHVPIHISDYIQIAYVILGHLDIEINGTLKSFHENDLFLIDTNTPYKQVIDSSDGIVMYFCLRNDFFDKIFLENIPLDSLQGFIRQCLFHQKSKRKYLQFTPHDDKDKDVFDDLISNIFLEFKNGKIGYLYIIKGLLIRLIDFLVNNFHYSFNTEEEIQYKKYLFHDIDQYIKEHYFDITLDDLSRKFHYQNNYFSKILMDYTNMTFSEYIIYLRIEKAKILLESTKFSIEYIITAVGYHNKGFFYKVFQNSTGLTPAAYRKAFLAS